MRVEIKEIIDHGHNDERIVLSVLADDDIGKYIVMDSTYTLSGGVSNKVRHPYWFPDKNVRKGDLVVLYTKKGKQSDKVKEDKSTVHFFYWDLDIHVWNDDGDCALLFHIDRWMSNKAPSKK